MSGTLKEPIFLSDDERIKTLKPLTPSADSLMNHYHRAATAKNFTIRKDISDANSGVKGRTRPQPITQLEPVVPVPYTTTCLSLSSDELSNDAREAKRLKSTLVENLRKKTDRELRDYVWTNKRNVGNFEKYLPDKAVGIKETIKCYEDEIERRARLLRPQASTQDVCAELEKVSCVLSMLSSPNKFYTPQGDPLDEEAEKAKQTLIELLNKNFETIVGSPDEERVKSCITILTKNVHKLPRFQGRVIEALNTEFKSACQNWKMCHTNHQLNIAFEVQQGDNLRVLKDWHEKDMEIKSKIETVHADILRLKAELREKELTEESLVKQKSDLFDQSKMSIDEAKKLLQEMVTVKLQSDVAVDNMNEIEAKWERTRENFNMKQV